MNLPPLPILTQDPKLPRGHYLVTDDLTAQLSKIPGIDAPVPFPDGLGPWATMPNGTCLSVYEDEKHERLCCKHVPDGAAVPGSFDKDQLLLDRYLDG